MSEEKQYYAFISYKREDEKWAKWLQHKLEHYKFPTNLNGQKDLPKNIQPTFRDVTDSTPGFLAKEINNALCNSQWLIVICSPRSAKSPWVCKEAQAFIDLGRADHIIPFVIEGLPFSRNVETECYPEALLELTGNQELLAANINEMGRDAAAIKVVARMFSLRFDTLWQRHKREERRRRYGIITLTIAIILFLLGLATYLGRLNGDLESKNTEIERQKEILQFKNDSLILTRDALEESNTSLTLRNEELQKANWKNMEIQARAVAIKAHELIREGDIYRGVALVMNVMPQNMSAPEKPIVPEMEWALRAADDSVSYGRKIQCVMKSHNGSVYDAAIMQNERIVATASSDNLVKFWDLETGEELANLRMPDFRFNTGYMTFSPDGKFFIKRYSEENPALSIWEIKQNGLKFVKLLQIGREPIFATDKNRLYIRGNLTSGTWKQIDEEKSKVFVYDSENWEYIGRADGILDSLYAPHEGLGLLGHDSIIMCNDIYTNLLSFKTKDGNTFLEENILLPSTIRYAKELVLSGSIFVTTDDGRSYVCHNPFTNGNTKNELISNVPNPFVVSPNDNFLATNTGMIYNINTHQISWRVFCYSNPFTGKEWGVSNSGQYYAYIKKGGGRKHDVVIKHQNTLDSIILSNPFSPKNTSDQLLSIAFGENEKMIIGGFRNYKGVTWDIKNNRKKELIGHQNGVTSVSFFDKDRYALTSSYDHTIRVWNLSSQKEIENLRIQINEKVKCSAISRDMRYLAITDGENIHIYDFNNSFNVSDIKSPNCSSIWFSEKGDLFSQNAIETDTLTTYDVYRYKIPSLDDLYEKYKYLKSYYLSPEERRKYYLE